MFRIHRENGCGSDAQLFLPTPPGKRSDVVNRQAASAKKKRLPTHAHTMTVTNATQLIRYSQIVPFKCRHSTYLCFYCGLEHTDPVELKNHTKNHRSSTKDIVSSIQPKNDLVKVDISCLDCKLCGAVIEELKSLKEHLIEKHGKEFATDAPDGVLPFRLTERLNCVICAKQYPFFRALSEHMNEHYNMYVCEYCGSGFASQSRLGSHALLHENKNLPCHLCGKIFKTQERLKSHVQLFHERKGKSRCPHCSERFLDHHRKLKHLIKVHNMTPLSFECNVCNKIFPSRRRLTTHTKRDHLKERLYHCTFCEQRFFTRYILKNHLTRHTKDRDYSCTMCSQSYSMPKTLREHVRKHHRTLDNLPTSEDGGSQGQACRDRHTDEGK